MSDDPLRRFFDEAAEPLDPPAGHYDDIVRRARHRKMRRNSVVAVAFVLIAGVGIGAATLATPGQRDSLDTVAGTGHSAHGGPGNHRHVSAPPAGPSHAPSAQPSRSPQPRDTATPQQTSPQVGLPAGGQVPSGFSPWSVTALGGGVRYVLGTAPCGTPPCTSLVRSTDGGRHWTGVPAPVAPLPAHAVGRVSPGSTVRDVRFATPADGWAFGGALYSTHDGGGTPWQRVDPGGSVLALETDGVTAYAIVATCDSQGLTCRNARLMSSPVDADNWQPVPGVAVSGDAGDSALSLSGSQVVAQLGSGTAARVFVNDGGPWIDRGANPCGPQTTDLVAASAAGSAVVAFCGEGAAGSLDLTAYESVGGRAWQQIAGRGARVPNGIVTVTAATADRLLIGSSGAAGGGALQRSADGGRTWAAAPAPAQPYGWRYVGASGAYAIVAVPGVAPDGSSANSTDSVFVSTDGGDTWTEEKIQ